MKGKTETNPTRGRQKNRKTDETVKIKLIQVRLGWFEPKNWLGMVKFNH